MLSRLSVFSIKKSIPLVTSVRCGHWNKHWKAGPYPKTEEERIAAAKKYNLLPEEYEPYEDDGWGWGKLFTVQHIFHFQTLKYCIPKSQSKEQSLLDETAHSALFLKL